MQSLESVPQPDGRVFNTETLDAEGIVPGPEGRRGKLDERIVVSGLVTAAKHERRQVKVPTLGIIYGRSRRQHQLDPIDINGPHTVVTEPLQRENAVADTLERHTIALASRYLRDGIIKVRDDGQGGKIIMTHTRGTSDESRRR